MSIRTENHGRTAILFVKGELTNDVLQSLQEAVTEELHSEEVVDITVDMTEVPFIDSAALEYLLDVKDSLAERLGVVTLVGCDENVLKILEITRLESNFHISNDTAPVVGAANSQS